MKPSSTESCVEALRALSQEIQSEDGVANAALAECADRMEKLEALVLTQQDRIDRLELFIIMAGDCSRQSNESKP